METNQTHRLDRIDTVLRPTTVTRIPRRHIIFDTESDRRYERGTESQTWLLGAYTLLDYHKENALPSGQVRVSHHNADMWKCITRLCRRGERTIAWAHNLGFDLRVSGAFLILPRLGWHLAAAVLERQAAWCRWTRDGATLVMCDLYSWIPVSLGTIAEDLGLNKIRLDETELEARCIRDVVITAKAVHEILTHLWQDDLGSFRPTGPGMAYSAFSRRHMTHKIVSHADETALKLERRAMWTGRCEVWQWGTDRGRPAWEYDIERAYAHIGKEMEVPTRLLAYRDGCSLSTFQTLTQSYRLLCDCHITSSVPVVPCESQGCIRWPIGTFRTTLWDTEIQLAIDNGAQVQIESVGLYRKAPALHSFCDWILKELVNHLTSTHCIWPRVMKSWSRSLIGRLALQYAEWEPVGIAPWYGAGISRTVRPETGEHGFDLHIGEDYFELGEIHEGYASVPMITGYVMAEARVRLWKIMLLAGLENVRYVDTDGLIVTSAGKKRLDSAIRQGNAYTLRCKRGYRAINIRAPRNLDLDWNRKVSGVPRKARWVSEGVYDGDIWRGVADSLSRSEPDSVKVLPRRFVIHQKDTRRIHVPHYQTIPYRLSDSQAVERS